MKLPLWRRRQDAELDEELASHLRMAIADRVARGESPEAASQAARREMGNLPLIKEVTRDTWGAAERKQVAALQRTFTTPPQHRPGAPAPRIRSNERQLADSSGD